MMTIPRRVSDRSRVVGRTVVGVALTGVLAIAVVLQAAGRAQPPDPTQPPAPADQQPPGQPPASPRPEAPAPGADQTAPREGQPQEGQPPVFRTGINFVRVDVIVTDKQGNPVGDLTPADFEVTEDGKPQTIETFKLVELTGNPPPGEAPRAIRSEYDEESEAQRDDVRIFVFMLDDYHVRRGPGMVMKEQLTSFIRNQLGPMDLLGVMYPLTPVDGVRLTRNHEAVVRAIESFDGRKFDYRPRNEFEDQYAMYPVEIVERIRVQVSLSALRSLVVHLGGLREGRKAVILVSEGYSYYVPPQLRDPNAQMPGIGNPAARRPMVGEGSSLEDRAQFFQNADLQQDMREVYNEANRANTAIYAVDPRGLAPFEYDINEAVGFRTDRMVLNATMDTLRTLADETDGRAIVNRNDLESGMRQIVRDTSAYYLVGYNSSQTKADGKFHAIKVRVKRPGLQVRARKGYWALSAEDAERVLAPPKPGPDPALTKALAAVEAPSRASAVRTWIGMASGDEGRTRVTLVWEPVPPVAGSERRSPPARLGVIAASSDGPAVFRGKVPDENADQTGPVTATAARGGRAVFEAPPGQLQMRLQIEDETGRVIDSDMLDVEVPDFTTPQVALSTLQVFRARTAREAQAINADPAPVPSAAREFRRTERLLVRFAATAPGTTPASAQARLLNRAGQPMTTLPVQPAPNAEGFLQVDLPLSGLPAGEFVLEVTASAGDAAAKQLFGFRVVS